MSSSLVISAADSSGRWYLLPGAANSYDLTVANESDHAVLCKLSLDEPAGAGTITPASLTLNAGESRGFSIDFKPDWLTLRDRKAIITARNAAGTVVATFVHDLVAATTTDCSVSLAWKEEIAGDGMLRGFVLTCAIRSISSTPGVFEPEFAQHPSLRFPEPQRITLGPGEASTFDVPIVWNRSARDNEGWNHPRTIEVGVGVTHGRRSATAPWDLVQQHIEPYINESDRAPVVTRRPPPPQFTQPGGVPPAISPLAVATPADIAHGDPISDTPAARIERAEMESGVAASAGRFPVPPPHVSASKSLNDRETIAVAPGTLVLIALAIGAIAIVFVLMLRTPVTTTAVSTGPVTVASPLLATALPAPRKHTAKTRPKPHTSGAGATRGAIASPDAPAGANTVSSVSTADAASGAPATQERAHAQTATHGGPGTHRASTPQRVSPIDHSALVQLDSVGAEYQHGGRLVHVYWNSYAQARAEIQLLDDRSTIISQTTVGRREGALLWLPRGYRGSVYVQVTAIGYDGERIVNSASLGPP
jgi:hypothetical protein